MIGKCVAQRGIQIVLEQDQFFYLNVIIMVSQPECRALGLVRTIGEIPDNGKTRPDYAIGITILP